MALLGEIGEVSLQKVFSNKGILIRSTDVRSIRCSVGDGDCKRILLVCSQQHADTIERRPASFFSFFLRPSFMHSHCVDAQSKPIWRLARSAIARAVVIRHAFRQLNMSRF
jgi:hypothetical protein